MTSQAESYRISGHHTGLDGVRGIAILGVMAIHFLTTTNPQNWVEKAISKASAYGGFGVDLFFVLSGFLITGILLESKKSPDFFRNFYMRRTLRIFPLYFGILALLFGVLPLFMSLGPILETSRDNQLWFWTYTSNFRVAQLGDWSMGALTHFWSLAVEEHFYLVWPFVVFVTSKKHLITVCISVFVLSLGLRCLLVYQGMNEISIGVLTPCRIDAMCIGGLFAILIREKKYADFIFQRLGTWALSVFVVIVLASVVLIATDTLYAYIRQFRSSLVVLFFATITAMGIKQPWRPAIAGRLLENRPLRFLGKYSYGLYVYHGILAWYIEEDLSAYLTSIVGHSTVGFLAKAIVASLLSLAISIVSFELFEKRFLHLKRYFENRKQAVSQ